ncbi:MAG: hypothetical protein RLZZ436_2191 [Planctomycetota bacterium]
MANTKSSKPADLATTCRELLAALDKFYGKSQQDLPPQVLEAMLLSVCLEDNSWEEAKAAYAKLLESYFDLNEIRVSSTAELAQTLSGIANPDWKGLRIRAILRNVFDSSYSFDLEKLRRQTPDLTIKALKKISELSPFVREFALQEILGTHTVALDNSMLKAAQWLGLLPTTVSLPDAMELLKGSVRKSDASSFCRQLRRLATDHNFSVRFTEALPAELHASDVLARLEELTTGKPRKIAKKADPAPAPIPSPAPPPAKTSRPARPESSAPAAPSKSSQPNRSLPAPAPSSKAAATSKPSKAQSKSAAPVPPARPNGPAAKAAPKAPAKKTAATKPASPAASGSAAAAAKKPATASRSPAKPAPAARKNRK